MSEDAPPAPLRRARSTAHALRRTGGSWWRRLRRPMPWRDRFLSENLRSLASLLISFALGMAALAVILPAGLTGEAPRESQITALLLLLIIVISLYSLLFAALTWWALREQPRSRLVGVARLPRARRSVPFYSMLLGRSGAGGEVLQLVLTAGIAILLLMLRPEGVPVLFLLVLTVGAIVTAWIGAVMTYTVEYIAEDAHGDAFALAGTPTLRRGLDDYGYAAVLIQTSAGPADLGPLTASARRLVRDHVILAHVTSTIIITLAVSAVITAVG